MMPSSATMLVDELASQGAPHSRPRLTIGRAVTDVGPSSIAGMLERKSEPSRSTDVDLPLGLGASKGCNHNTMTMPISSTHALTSRESKKKPSFLKFFTVKEPSAQAFADYQASMKKQQQSKGISRPTAVGLAMVSSAKLPASVPKVNSKWDGVPGMKKKHQYQSSDSLGSDASLRSSSRASRNSRGIQSSAASTWSFNPNSKSQGSESNQGRFKDARSLRSWHPLQSPKTPSQSSVPGISPGAGSALSTLALSPLDTSNEFVPRGPSEFTSSQKMETFKLVPLNDTTPAKSSLLSRRSRNNSTIEPPAVFPRTYASSSYSLSKPITNADPLTTAPIPIMADQEKPRPGTSHSSITNSSRPKLRRSDTAASGYSAKSRRTPTQQKAFEKVAPWEDASFVVPPLPNSGSAMSLASDVKDKKSRLSRFFKA